MPAPNHGEWGLGSLSGPDPKICPYRLKGPIQLDVTFKNYRPSELLSYLPSVERTDSHSIRFVGQDMVAISRFLEFLLSCDSTLEP